MRCRRCGREIALSSGERIPFADVCEGCGEDLHSCLHCAHHERTAWNECRESAAERVSDRERANRCEHFRPTEAAVEGRDAERAAALSELARLFKAPPGTK